MNHIDKKYMHHCLIMANNISARGSFTSVEERLFYDQLLRILNTYHRLEELILKEDLKTLEELLYGKSDELGGNTGDNPPDSTGITEN